MPLNKDYSKSTKNRNKQIYQHICGHFTDYKITEDHCPLCIVAQCFAECYNLSPETVKNLLPKKKEHLVPPRITIAELLTDPIQIINAINCVQQDLMKNNEDLLASIRLEKLNKRLWEINNQ